MTKPRAEVLRDAWNKSGAPLSQWVVEARADEVIVVDDANPCARTFMRVPAVISGSDVVFGAAQPYDPDADKVLVYASAAESRPDALPADPLPDPAPEPAPPADPESAPEPPAAEPDNDPSTDPKKEDPVSDLSANMRTRLGLPDDADQSAILAAFDAVKAKADNPEPNPEQVAASAAADQKREELEKEVAVMASTLADVTARLAASEQEKAATVKASVLDDAVRQGKIRPSDRDQWSKDYDDAPPAITRILASIAPGTAVPVAASGEVTSPESVDVDAEWAQFAHLFPAESGSKEG